MAQAWKKWQLKVLTPYCCISPDSTVYLIDSDSNRWIICYLWRYLVELQFSWHQNIMQFNNYKQQESLANAKVSDDSLSALVYGTQLTKLAPHLGSPSNINVIYTLLKSTVSAQQFPR